MRILMLAPEPFFEPRGTPISVYQRLSALSSLGYEVDLVTYHVGEDVTFPNVTIYRTPDIPFVHHVKIGPSLLKPFLDVLLFLRAVLLLFSRRYDVIHSHEEAAFMAVPLAFLFRTYHIYDMHSSLPQQLVNFNYGKLWPLVKLFELLERLTLRTADAVITVGDDLREHVYTHGAGVRHHKIENVSLYNSFAPSDEDTKQLRQKHGLESRPVVVYTGTFETYQGLPLLLDSVKTVREAVPNVAFVLVGGSPAQVEALRTVAGGAGLQETIFFTGTVSPAEALAYTEMADVLVSPRINGTSVPLKTYSYLQTGKPIVATRIEAHTQVLTNDTALLVDVSAESLALGIICVLQDGEFAARIGKRARKLAEDRYSFESLQEKIRGAYQPFWRELRPVAERSTSYVES